VPLSWTNVICGDVVGPLAWWMLPLSNFCPFATTLWDSTSSGTNDVCPSQEELMIHPSEGKLANQRMSYYRTKHRLLAIISPGFVI
jgi:hypothetical protein